MRRLVEDPEQPDEAVVQAVGALERDVDAVLAQPLGVALPFVAQDVGTRRSATNVGGRPRRVGIRSGQTRGSVASAGSAV